MASRDARPHRARDTEPSDRERHRRHRQGTHRNAQSSRAALSTSGTGTGTGTGTTSTNTLSEGALAKLNALNEKSNRRGYDRIHESSQDIADERYEDERRERARRAAKREQRRRKEAEDHNHYREPRRQRRVVSGPLLEEGTYEKHPTRSRHNYETIGGGSNFEDEDARKRKKRKWIWISVILVLVILIIAIAAGISLSKKKTSNTSTSSPSSTSTSTPSNSNLNGVSSSDIPVSAQGTYLDPFTWYDTTDFNVTYTNATVGGLSVMGLNTTWSDQTQANSNVPQLNETWQYGTRVIRGINLGGWLSIEPFITPSLFNQFPSSQGVIDEWTLCQTLGPAKAKSVIEQHYATFVTEQTFADIQAAGFDHIRIPYSYWAVTTYDNDPYVAQVSWRYLLRGLEWARKYGLRINLDLHALPGSQNGWNHSGHQGPIGWLNGTDGALNAQRSLAIHAQLTTFFAQPRYANLVTMYGLVNEPRMTFLSTTSVLAWTTSAITTVRSSGMPNSTIIVIGDGFLGLANWQGLLSDHTNVLLDAHQYVVFNNDQLALPHGPKVNFACQGWAQQTNQSMNPSTGFGNFLCGEWSQADTDCAPYLNDVDIGSRWEGTLNTGNASTSVLTPTCPTDNNPRCDCTGANADPSTYSAEYKQWLLDFAEAQMSSYELGWGWFYWTWQTENAVQWSYKLGMEAGILPTNVQAKRAFGCVGDAPDYARAGLSETY